MKYKGLYFSSPQGLPARWAPGEPAQRLQPPSEVCCDHRQGPHAADHPADHEGAAWAGRCDPSLHPRPLGLGGGKPASHWWSPVGLWSALCGVPAGQPQRPAPDCGGLPIQDRTGPRWWGRTLIRNIDVTYCLTLCCWFEKCCILQTQLSPVSKGAYRDYLGKLDLQYGKLLVNIFIFKAYFSI